MPVLLLLKISKLLLINAKSNSVSHINKPKKENGKEEINQKNGKD